jgi:hypothetical protein
MIHNNCHSRGDWGQTKGYPVVDGNKLPNPGVLFVGPQSDVGMRVTAEIKVDLNEEPDV